jgi:hypothetical protein
MLSRGFEFVQAANDKSRCAASKYRSPDTGRQVVTQYEATQRVDFPIFQKAVSVDIRRLVHFLN